MKCEYGCNQIGSYSIGKKICCSKSQNNCPAIREKNSKGLKKAYEQGIRAVVGFDDSSRQASIDSKKQKALDDLVSNNSSYRCNHFLKKIINENSLLEYKCFVCSTNTWNGKKLSLELDHIDGNSFNCNLSNLRYLCPNCHSQTDSFRGRGVNTGKKKVTDEQLLESIKNSPNIRQALINVNLSPRGGNYTRATKLAALL
jgi:5-methylcytosine-specific restriction endonuclease McrA